jgi:hypothetical protein
MVAVIHVITTIVKVKVTKYSSSSSFIFFGGNGESNGIERAHRGVKASCVVLILSAPVIVLLSFPPFLYKILATYGVRRQEREPDL